MLAKAFCILLYFHLYDELKEDTWRYQIDMGGSDPTVGDMYPKR